MIDGVSANVGIGANPQQGNGAAGALPGFSAQGGTNSLISVDALQEFRIQTSTYAPEFGRTPGGQISIVTRSGTNQFHGTVFDYLRNDLLDANNWFANSTGLRKPQERQNDFGGTFSGPLFKNRTFFFFSYEGLRLRLPQTTLTTVPDLLARQNAAPAMKPFLNAFPLPNGPDNTTTGIAQFNATYSNPSTLNAYSLRIDPRFNDSLSAFGRYNFSPSRTAQRGAVGLTLNTVSPVDITLQTATLGALWTLSSTATNDFRFNFSRTRANSTVYLDNFGGATVLDVSTVMPSPFTTNDSQFALAIFSLTGGTYLSGRNAKNIQRQYNFVDAFSFVSRRHSIKFGLDYRRLAPIYNPDAYFQEGGFLNVSSAESGSVFFAFVVAGRNAVLEFQNLGAYAQDTWKIGRQLTITYGLRWDIDVAPYTTSGPNLAAVTNFSDLSKLALAPDGTSIFGTRYGNLAPRLGLAYQLGQKDAWQTVLRGAFGVFYDLATVEIGQAAASTRYPFGASKISFGGTFPLDAATAAPPAISAQQLSQSGSNLFSVDPNLNLPYALQWTAAMEQSIGHHQSLTTTYLGAVGRRLIATESATLPPTFSQVYLATNAGTSDYHSLQTSFQRRFSRGLQALASYTWAHSIDTGSASSLGANANLFVRQLGANQNRGPSDFDIRNAFSLGLTYDIPSPKINSVMNAALKGWSIQNIVQARSAPPVDVSDAHFSQFNGGIFGDIRPDLVPGQAIYLYGSQYPGGKALNSAAFTDPPKDPQTGKPARQGTASRNLARGFGAAQWDLGVHRDFPIRESLNLQFRAEMLNVVNHPNFASPSGLFGRGGFGLSSQMLGQQLADSNQAGGAFSPLYQIGGPRSIQFALKLSF